jgi:hypothetical protein
MRETLRKFVAKYASWGFPETLNQKKWHQPGPDPLDRNSSRAEQHFPLDCPIAILTLKMCEPRI